VRQKIYDHSHTHTLRNAYRAKAIALKNPYQISSSSVNKTKAHQDLLFD